MTLPNTPLIIPAKSQEGIIQFQRACYTLLNQQWNLREQMRKIDLAYIREMDLTNNNTRAKVANQYGDADKLRNLVIPVVMPQVESAVVYQTSVFLQGTPLFGVVASPEYEDQAVQMETVIDENAIRGKWVQQLMMHFRDGFKYNIAALEIAWDREVTASLETDINFTGGRQGKPKEVIWEGNCLRRWDMYNTFFDSRVAPSEMHQKGEFVGRTELMSRIQLKYFLSTLPDKMISNVRAAFESGMGSTASTGTTGGIESFYTPPINPDAMLNKDIRTTIDWLQWASITGADKSGIAYRNVYEVTTMYARIIPSDFDLRVPGANTVQVWKFIIVNHQVLIYAERQTNAHGYMPVLFSQPNEDGFTYQTKSLAVNVLPIQDISTALMNSVIASKRRSISDRAIYDPSRINAADVNSANPSAKIPLRPSAYGKNASEAYFPIPYRDDQSPMTMQQIQMMNQYANVISGQNPVKQGQFVKGNKTLHEYEDVMSHANGRDQMTSMLYEAQLFTPLKQILKTNILQYQGGTSYYSRDKNKQVDIDPVALRKAVMEFKVSDGLTPSDKLVNSDVMMVAMQQIGSSPAIGAQYNIGPMFSYLMKTQGAHITSFEKTPEQVAYETAVQQWQQLVQQLVSINKDIKPEQYPPQPIPANYNYLPGATPQEQDAANKQKQSQQPVGAGFANAAAQQQQQPQQQ